MTKIKVLEEFSVPGLPLFEVGSVRLAEAETAKALAERGLVEIVGGAEAKTKVEQETATEKKDSKSK